MRRRVKPAKDKVEGKLPAPRKSSKGNEASRVSDPERHLAEALGREAEALKRENEALEQQSATAEILGIISRSPSDAQPVFDAIAVNALRLCDAEGAVVMRYDGGLLHVVAHHNVNPEAVDRLRHRYPRVPDRLNPAGRAVLDGAVVHVPDLQTTTEFADSVSRQSGNRSYVAIPLLHQGRVLGTIGISRRTLRPFSDREIVLLQTFAEQAVIAIENVRLFRELQEKHQALTQAHGQVTEALEQQTATSEILRVISRSPTDVQPVFDAIVRSAVTLCDGLFSSLFRFDGKLIYPVAQHNFNPDALEELHRRYPAPPSEAHGSARAILERAAVHIPDVEVEPGYQHLDLTRALGMRSGLWVPMLRDGDPIGVVMVARAKPGSFAGTQIKLLETFADQAVIAIENVRLFKELEARNRDLTESLEHQTATSEILRVISSSPSDVAPVFATIARNAMRLLGGATGGVFLVTGDRVQFGASATRDRETVGPIGGLTFPMSLSEFSRHRPVLAQVLGTRAPASVADMETDPRTTTEARQFARAVGFRSTAIVPMLRNDELIGLIVVARAEPRATTDDEIALLQTFADQAVIAIENVRLFKELEERNRDLSAALDQQTATSEILGVISRSPTDIQPVFDVIVQSAVRLCGGLHSNVYLVGDGFIDLVAHHNFSPAALEDLRRRFPIPVSQAEGLAARVIREGIVVHLHDAQTDPGVPETTRRITRALGAGSVLYVPMLRDRVGIGALVVSRAEVKPFSDKEIALIRTFADQAVIAIENVRLFNETKEALERQTATSEILRVISSSPTDAEPVFRTILANANALCDARFSVLWLWDGEALTARAHENVSSAMAEHLRTARPRPHRGTPLGLCMLEQAVVHVPDVASDPRFKPEDVPTYRLDSARSTMSAPMIREGSLVGVINIWRREPRAFTDNQVALLRTFADQAVIAIENVRLFKELQSSNRELTTALDQQTATSEVLRTIAQTKTDPQPVFDTIVRSAAKLCHAHTTAVFLTDGRTIHHPANYGDSPEALAAIKARFPRPLDKETAAGNAILTRSVIHVPDVEKPSVVEFVRQTGRVIGFRSLLSIPMLRQDEAVGAINVTRREPGPFSEGEVALLKTFADQAVIALENVRLFRELEGANRELSAASQHKSEFLANMSHELRTPLNAIIGFSEVLSERMFGELNEKQEEYLKDIYASGTHLLSLINDILDLSKIEAGRMELELTDFHLPQAIDNALILVRERAGRRGITLEHSVDERLGEIRGDERKVKQVLLNLLSNALKFTPEGGRVEVRAGMVDDMAEISVTDTGVGIAPEDQRAIFEEFRQVGTADKKAEGTGLGLTLCRKFVELHGGRIWVKSGVGAGATFTFTIPVRRAE